MQNKGDIASEHFKNGANCAQAVLSAFAGDYGMDEETVYAVCRGFGAGVGYTGGMCGAVSGAVMALGMSTKGDSDNSGAKIRIRGPVQEFLSAFSEKNGSILCRDLIGCSLRTEEERLRANEEGRFQTTCAPLVRDAAEIAEEILKKTE